MFDHTFTTYEFIMVKGLFTHLLNMTWLQISKFHREIIICSFLPFIFLCNKMKENILLVHYP